MGNLFRLQESNIEPIVRKAKKLKVPQGSIMSQWHKGKVQWFDKLSGEGVVIADNGEAYYVHYSTIVNKAKQTKTTMSMPIRRNLESGKSVEFQIYENLHSKRVDKIKQV